jgi:hypothetical protein
MVSIMQPVLGAPLATGVTSTGGIATQTPGEEMLRYSLQRWNSSISTKTCGLHNVGRRLGR